MKLRLVSLNVKPYALPMMWVLANQDVIDVSVCSNDAQQITLSYMYLNSKSYVSFIYGSVSHNGKETTLVFFGTIVLCYL